MLSVWRVGKKKRKSHPIKKPSWGIIKVLFKMMAEGLRVRARWELRKTGKKAGILPK